MGLYLWTDGTIRSAYQVGATYVPSRVDWELGTHAGPCVYHPDYVGRQADSAHEVQHDVCGGGCNFIEWFDETGYGHVKHEPPATCDVVHPAWRIALAGEPHTLSALCSERCNTCHGYGLVGWYDSGTGNDDHDVCPTCIWKKFGFTAFADEGDGCIGDDENTHVCGG